jgi:MSHA pilin protein MshA
MEKRNIVKNQKGFTLIEIIAVLVILGVLAAVAVPKYMDITDEAEAKAASGAIAEMMSQCSLTYAKLCLTETTGPSGVTAAKVVAKIGATFITGDFSGTLAAVAASGTGDTAVPGKITITVTKINNAAFADGITPPTDDWTMPSIDS